MQLLELVGEPGSGEGANYNAHVECQFLGSGDNYGENEASWIAAEFWSADAVGVCGNSWIRACWAWDEGGVIFRRDGWQFCCCSAD